MAFSARLEFAGLSKPEGDDRIALLRERQGDDLRIPYVPPVTMTGRPFMALFR